MWRWPSSGQAPQLGGWENQWKWCQPPTEMNSPDFPSAPLRCLATNTPSVRSGLASVMEQALSSVQEPILPTVAPDAGAVHDQDPPVPDRGRESADRTKVSRPRGTPAGAIPVVLSAFWREHRRACDARLESIRPDPSGEAD